MIQDLKSSPNREKLERRLLKNDVLWKNAEPIIIDNKKRILVPFLSINKDNVIGVLSLVKDSEGKTTFDMVVRKDLVNKNTQFPFWKRSLWAGYFMALDKDILGIKNGSPGLSKKLDGDSKLKNQTSKTMQTVCGDIPVRRICITYSECESFDDGETWGNCIELYTDCYYEYDWQCWEVPDDPTDPTDPIVDCEEYYKKSTKNNRILINNNNLCGTYNFKHVGYSYVANITGLGFSATGPNCHKLAVEIPIICVTIPHYNLPLALCSAKFNIAWNTTMNEVMTYLNNTQGLVNPTPWYLRGLILEYLTSNLNYQAGLDPYSTTSVTVITSSCPGPNFSKAIYCK